jgi:hypothetical protein
VSFARRNNAHPEVKLRAPNRCFRQAAEHRHQIEENLIAGLRAAAQASKVSIASMLQQHR